VTRKRDPFTRLDAVADGLLRRAPKGEGALHWLSARWDRIVGEPLARKIAPESLDGRRLTLALLDPAWRKPVEATLPEIERKLAREMPELRPQVYLRQVVGDR
jgi:Dna[CI] antecedent, DciA